MSGSPPLNKGISAGFEAQSPGKTLLPKPEQILLYLPTWPMCLLVCWARAGPRHACVPLHPHHPLCPGLGWECPTVISPAQIRAFEGCRANRCRWVKTTRVFPKQEGGDVGRHRCCSRATGGGDGAGTPPQVGRGFCALAPAP